MRRRFPRTTIDLARPIVEAFGGAPRLSAISGIKPRTINAWIASGTIPEKYRYGLLVLARENEVPIGAQDFIAYLERRLAA